MPEPFQPLPRQSFSALTIYEIRYGRPRKAESNQDRVTRLCATYGLDVGTMRLLIGVGDDYIDLIGRIRE